MTDPLSNTSTKAVACGRCGDEILEEGQPCRQGPAGTTCTDTSTDSADPIRLTPSQQAILDAMDRGERIRLLTADEAMVRDRNRARALARFWEALLR